MNIKINIHLESNDYNYEEEIFFFHPIVMILLYIYRIDVKNRISLPNI